MDVNEHERQSKNKSTFCEFLVFNASFSNILAISWRPVSVVEEAGVPGENHRPWASIIGKLYHLRLRVECIFFFLYH
jgi:hypothetical protein